MDVLFYASVLVILYTYVLYPGAVWVLARLRPAPAGAVLGDAPSVSVLLVVRDEARHVRERLDNLLAQSPRERVGEIVVVSDGSRDGTVEEALAVATEHPRVRVLALPRPVGKSGALREGLAQVRSEAVVFADARQRFAPGCIAHLTERLRDPSVGAVSGELRFAAQGAGDVGDAVGLYWRYETAIRRAEARWRSLTGCAGAVYAARLALIVPPPRGLVLDDVWIPMQVAMAGHRVAYEPEAVAWDRLSASTGDEFRRKVRTLAGNVQLVRAMPQLLLPWRNPLWWQFVSHKLARLLVPYALIGLLFSSAMLSAEAFPYALVLSGQLAAYSLALFGVTGERLGGHCRVCSLAKNFVWLNLAALWGGVLAVGGRRGDLLRTWKREA